MNAGLASTGEHVVGDEVSCAVSQWDMKDGLPLNKVRAVAQTPDGYLWVGTFNGLARFDGVHFETLPFEVRPTHFFKHHQITLPMCDHASAGNAWNSADMLRTWLPQPLFLRDMYPPETWRLMCPDLKECPPIPAQSPSKMP